MARHKAAWLLATLVTVGPLVGCTSDEPSTVPSPAVASIDATEGSATQDSDFTFDAASMTTDITNPYWPMPPGAHWVYRETDGDSAQRVDVRVTGRTKSVAIGVDAVVVHDVVTEDGELVEDTFDWYAQDGAGNIWYLGEDTVEYEHGEPVSTEGSWEAGVDGAEPGVAVPADPVMGMAYRQEYLAGEAEDEAVVVSLDQPAGVPYGRFEQTLMTRDATPLEPRVAELKCYAEGVGMVLALQTSGGASREELLSVTGLP